MIERPVEAEITFYAFRENVQIDQKTKQIKKQFDNTCAAFYKAHQGHHTNGCLLTIKIIEFLLLHCCFL